MSDLIRTYDPFDPQVQQDPYPVYKWLRDNAPAYWARGANTWVLSRYDDVSTALAAPETFSSAKGIFPSPPGVDQSDLFLPMLIMTDPPRHTQLRALVSRAFTPRRISLLETSIAQTTERLLEQIPTGPWDFVTDFAGPLPAIVIAELLGIPSDDRNQFRSWSSTLVQANPLSGARDGLAAAASLYEYFAGFLAERRRSPKKDLISDLVNAEVAGEGLTDDEVLGFCLLLLVAGHETTTNLLANSVAILATRPQERARMAQDPVVLASAIEELLRYDSPVQGLSRTLTQDVTLHGKTLHSGQTALLLFGSANRDHRAFPDADEFLIERQPGRQVAFGRGPHFCLGAALARMEARIALHSLLNHATFKWQADLPAARRLNSGPIRGYASLPVQ
jgi:cytochrome P450